MVEKTAIKQPAYDLAVIRTLFETTRPGMVYLNHAGMSPLSLPVKQVLLDTAGKIAADGGEAYESVKPSLFARLPASVARLVNAKPEEVAFTENTSTAINIIAQGLPLQAGDNVLLCDVEFPSNVYPWLNLQQRGIEVRFVPSQNGGLSIDGLEAIRTPESRVVAVSGVQFFTGRREDLISIGQYCAEHDLFLVVDAIQAAGIVPLDMQTMGIHALAAGGQKALMAPPGQGFMVIRSELIEQMKPVFIGPTSVANYEHWLDYDTTLQPGARRFDMGTTNILGLVGLLAAIELLTDIGIEHIAEWVTHLSDVAIANLQDHGYRVITPVESDSHAHIVTFAWDGDPVAAIAHLKSNGVIMRSHQDAEGNNYLRISTHVYNTEEDVLRVIEVLEGIRL